MSDLRIHPTHKLQGTYTHKGFHFLIGKPLPFGASLVANGVNFSVYSYHATSWTLVLYEKGAQRVMVEIPLPVLAPSLIRGKFSQHDDGRDTRRYRSVRLSNVRYLVK
jgi:hypothetical protein